VAGGNPRRRRESPEAATGFRRLGSLTHAIVGQDERPFDQGVARTTLRAARRAFRAAGTPTSSSPTSSGRRAETAARAAADNSPRGVEGSTAWTPMPSSTRPSTSRVGALPRRGTYTGRRVFVTGDGQSARSVVGNSPFPARRRRAGPSPRSDWLRGVWAVLGSNQRPPACRAAKSITTRDDGRRRKTRDRTPPAGSRRVERIGKRNP
jgi:hypothetical protein